MHEMLNSLDDIATDFNLYWTKKYKFLKHAFKMFNNKNHAETLHDFDKCIQQGFSNKE